METDSQHVAPTGTVEIPKELEAAITSKVAEIVAKFLETTKDGRSRSKSRSRSRGGRSRSRSRGDRSRSRSRGRRYGSRSPEKSYKHGHFGPRHRGPHGKSRKPMIEWEDFGIPHRYHRHFHHHSHHGWFGGEFGPWARRGRWDHHRRRFDNCKCGVDTEQKESEEENNKEGTPAAERNLRSDLEYLDLQDDSVTDVN